MNLHEYQAKILLEKYGLPVTRGILGRTPREVVDAYREIGDKFAVIKAQVHAGGRGKVGGVKVVESAEEAEEVAKNLLGTRLVTHQTDENGQPVNSLLVCKDVYPVQKEFYFSATVDRKNETITFIASAEGGMDIEEISEKYPEKIHQLSISPLTGVLPNHARELAAVYNLDKEQTKAFTKIMQGAYKAFVERDLELLEINPLSILEDGSLMCVDAKIAIDDNAGYRQGKYVAERDITQENEYELKAAEYGLNYVDLDGNIGCMVNGAGLAMATMDIIKLYGASPANFLDVGGGANKEAVIAAFKLILSDKNVKGILINIFGGIVRGNMIAESIVEAMKEAKVEIPVVVRIDGNNAKEGAEIIEKSGLSLIAASDLADAAKKIIAAVE